MMYSKKIIVFVLVLIIVAACEARKSKTKNSKSSDKQQFKYPGNNKGIWPFSSTYKCNYTNTLDTDYKPNSVKEEDLNLPQCGLNHASVSRLKSSWNIFKEYLSKAGQAIEKIKSYGEGQVKSSRIINGQVVGSRDWPWLALIGTFSGGVHCGATIINKKFLVTAAHCFEDRELSCNYMVRAGVRNWAMDSEGAAYDRVIVGIYRHPDYDTNTKANDIALIKLDSDLPLSPESAINAICLPSAGRSVKRGTNCFVAGWGTQVNGADDTVALAAMMTTVPVIGYDGDKCGEYEKLYPGMVCAGFTDGSTDTCEGDSGGPLIYKKDKTYYLLGATSYGRGCAMKGYPGIYTDVGQYRNWIYSVLTRFY